jgi:hypothetical protein
LTPLSDQDDEKDWYYLQKPKPTTSDVQEGLQMADDHVYHSFQVDQFMDRYLKFKHVTAPYKEVCITTYIIRKAIEDSTSPH